jgi:hypothetical protein
MKKQLFSLAAVFAFGLKAASAFTLITGTSNQITSPDDLFLDPGSVVIAVNVVNGANPDLDVNGVTFQGDGGAVALLGTTVNGGVTLTTERVSAAGGGEITTWATAPTFTGGTGASAANLGEVMRSIRWASGAAAGVPNGGGINITTTGLSSTSLYDVQLLFNESADNDRRFDIGVEGLLVADDFSSEGGDGMWTPGNSYSYRGQFSPGADGVLDIRLQADLGGDPFTGADGNPIIGAVIIHEIPEPSTGLLFGLAAASIALRRRRR